MDRATVARKLREALFDHIETGRREALQDSSIDQLFERVLAACESPTPLVRGESRTWTATAPEICSSTVLHDRAGYVLSHPANHVSDAWNAHSVDHLGNRFTYSASSGWVPISNSPQQKTPPAIGDVNFETHCVYAYRNGVADWVHIDDPAFMDLVRAEAKS